LTDGTATLTGGSLTNIASISATSGTINSLTDGTATLTGGNLTGLNEIESTSLEVDNLIVNKAKIRTYNYSSIADVDFVDINNNIRTYNINYNDVSGGILFIDDTKLGLVEVTSVNFIFKTDSFTAYLNNLQGITFLLTINTTAGDYFIVPDTGDLVYPELDESTQINKVGLYYITVIHDQDTSTPANSKLSIFVSKS
jgi:hypothetical protein